MPSLVDRVALVTGAGRGLGRACAMRFAEEGAKVVVAEINHASGAETVAMIRDIGGEAILARADISNASDVATMVATAVERFGRLDCAVNNAVYDIGRHKLADIDEAAWDAALAVNYTGTFLCMKYEIREMLKGGGGAIVNIGSANEHSAVPGLSWYLGAKQACYGLTKVAALDYAARGIRVNAVAPGPMWTPALRATAAASPGHIEAHVAHVPMRRIAEPQEVAAAAVWLCSPAASYVMGHTMSVDGGYILGS